MPSSFIIIKMISFEKTHNMRWMCVFFFSIFCFFLSLPFFGSGGSSWGKLVVEPLAKERPLANESLAALFSNRGKATLSAWTQRSSAHACFGPAPIEIFHGAYEGSPQMFTPPQKKTCVFRNLCRSGDTFIYFQDPAHPLPFEFSNTRGPLFDAPDPLVDTGASTHIYLSQDDWLHITVVSGAIPSSFKILDDPAVHVLVTPRFLDNPGHEFGDSTWPTFNAMMDSSMLDVSNQIVFLPIRGNGPGGTGYSTYPGRTYESLSRRPIQRLDAFDNNTCFSWALAGNGGRYLTSPLPSPFSWRVLHDFVYERYSMQHNNVISPENTEPINIVIRFKKHRHTFTNYNELFAELRRCYPSSRVHLFKPEDTQTFKDELSILSSASVYITAGGGGAFSSIFLPTNAVVIYAAACWPSNASNCAVTSPSGVCCVQVERHIWSNLPHLHIAYYNYDGSPLSIVGNAGHYFALDQDYFANITQIFALIDRGLFLSRGRNFNTCGPSLEAP